MGGPPSNVPQIPFDRRLKDVTEEIRSRLDAIQDGKIRDENGREVPLLRFVSKVLVAGAPSSGQELREHLASFLTERPDDTHLAQLVWHVFDPLCKQGKKELARVIGEVVDLMLPLYLPQEILSEAWVQLEDHGAVLIQNAVARKAGAEILVAGLFKKKPSFTNSSPEPTGEQFVAFEDVPIDDPERGEELALRELYIAAFHAETIESGKSVDTRPTNHLTAAQIKADLTGPFKASRIRHGRPRYCAVKLAAKAADRRNQVQLLSRLAIPDLLFIGLNPDSKTRAFEGFVIECLNGRFESESRGFPA